MALIALNPAEARTAAAIFERMFPAGEDVPGACGAVIVPPGVITTGGSIMSSSQ